MPTETATLDNDARNSARQKLIFALDYPKLEDAHAAARETAEAVGMFKIGLELFVAHGPAALALGSEFDRPIFLDLKLHDIPATVGRAAARAATLGARYLTVHAAGGPAMLQQAVAACQDSALEIVAVTVLTSMDQSDLEQTGVADPPDVQAQRLASMAYASGIRNFVCSPSEVAKLKAALGTDAKFITPGVRPSHAAHGDQKRVATPHDAIQNGADMLVVGRPIRDASAPLAAARSIVDAIAAASA